ncbi:unnamed protein product [Tuber aestivum]|uniref:Kelch repeat protein n=1 Tax=Tuber aestivum TaxID=59557 RepID=A0A292PKU8_9PEZI|nr:unnamed protein product [Tuber aestivum]
MIFIRALWAAFWVSSLALAQTNKTIQRLGAKTVEPDINKQTWDWKPDSRCRLLAHESIVVNSQGKDLLIFDGGLAKFRHNWNGENIEVLELNPRTVVIDLSKSFSSRDFIPISQPKKPLGVPVVNRFGLWKGSNQDWVVMQGGHFYDADDWRNSSYWVEKKDIPPYTIWKYDLKTLIWTEIALPDEMRRFKRAFGGAAVSVPRTDKSYYIGGLWTPRASNDSFERLAVPQSGMLVYDHKTGTLTNETFGEPGMAYWHGSANHLEIGEKAGFLIALMAETAPGGVPIEDKPGINDEHGSGLSFEYVMLYDLDGKKWINQSTTFYKGEAPITRTRFCGQTVYSDETKTWELWVHGGMLMEPLGEAAPDAWVLTMPSFIWTRVEVPDSMVRMRSHTCNAVGSQLLIIGGYPPSAQVEKDAPCDSELIKVLDMNQVTWSSHYTPGTVYKTPEIVRKNAEFHLNRVDPHSGWADDSLRDAFHYTRAPPPAPPPPPNLSSGKIAAIGVSSAVVLALVVFGSCVAFGLVKIPRFRWPLPRLSGTGGRPGSARSFPGSDQGVAK